MTPINFFLLPSVMKNDAKHVILRQLLQGEEWAISNLSNNIPQDDFSKIMAVRQKLIESANTLRATYEGRLPVPSSSNTRRMLMSLTTVINLVNPV